MVSEVSPRWPTRMAADCQLWRSKGDRLMTPDLDWWRYRPALHDNALCLYMLTYVPFDFAPRYVGEAVGFLPRSNKHQTNFRGCKYTVLLPSFAQGARAHRDFAFRWHQVGALPTHVFVPGAGQTINPADSLAHWAAL